MLRIAVQSKGRLYDETMMLLEEAGIKLNKAKRTLLLSAKDFPVEVLFLRDDDIPQSVANGTADVGIVGENEYVEKGSEAELIKRLGFSKCRLSLAIPKDEDYNGVTWFEGKTIATSYPGILKTFLQEKGIKANTHVITGSVEIAPGIGLADAIFDIVSSGSTLVSNQLKEVEVVMQSEALLIGNKDLTDEKREILNELLFRFEAIQMAEGKKYVLLNAPKDKLDEIIEVLPGMKSPTVTPLANGEWVSVGDSRETFLGNHRETEILGCRRNLGIANRENDIIIGIGMEIIKYPEYTEWKNISKRATMDVSTLFDTVRQVLDDVRINGDAAIRKYEKQFDKVDLTNLLVSEEEIAEAESLVSEDLKQAIRTAKENIETFHASQRFEGKKIQTAPGVVCWQKAVPIEKVGLYVPGGTAPLFSTVLMLAVPAQIAGCKEIVLCTPPSKTGKIHPAILFAAKVAGVNKICKVGGSQAIAAMAYGTESIPKVYKIFGPGNQYVTAAKQWVSLKEVAIDMPAGPSEVEVIADEFANPDFIAADFLSQAEHGVDSQAILVTTTEAIVEPVVKAIEEQLKRLPRLEITEKALAHSRIIVLKNTQEVIDFTNYYAPEHLIIQTRDYGEIAEKIRNAGSVFMGPYTPESAGDYASGTNHTLPTNGYAHAYSGVNLDSFIKKMTFQEISADGIRQLGDTIRTMAANEELEAHRNAVTVRLNAL